MGSSFLVFDLVGGNAGLECERNARGFIQPVLEELRAILIAGVQELPESPGKSFLREGEILERGL